MKGSLTGIAGEIGRLKRGLNKALIRPANTAMRQATMAAVRSYFANTPVWSGEAVRNYRVAIGRAPSGFSTPVGGSVTFPGGPFPEDVKNEARRGANQAAALAAISSALKPTNQGQELTRTIWIKNTIPANKAALIEAGAAPTRDRSRYPGGLSAKATNAAVAAGKGLLK